MVNHFKNSSQIVSCKISRTQLGVGLRGDIKLLGKNGKDAELLDSGIVIADSEISKINIADVEDRGDVLVENF